MKVNAIVIVFADLRRQVGQETLCLVPAAFVTTAARPRDIILPPRRVTRPGHGAAVVKQNYSPYLTKNSQGIRAGGQRHLGSWVQRQFVVDSQGIVIERRQGTQTARDFFGEATDNIVRVVQHCEGLTTVEAQAGPPIGAHASPIGHDLTGQRLEFVQNVVVHLHFGLRATVDAVYAAVLALFLVGLLAPHVGPHDVGKIWHSLVRCENRFGGVVTRIDLHGHQLVLHHSVVLLLECRDLVGAVRGICRRVYRRRVIFVVPSTSSSVDGQEKNIRELTSGHIGLWYLP
jgi:hypothetical protein